jgi:hypothetical protein
MTQKQLDEARYQARLARAAEAQAAFEQKEMEAIELATQVLYDAEGKMLWCRQEAFSVNQQAMAAHRALVGMEQHPDAGDLRRDIRDAECEVRRWSKWLAEAEREEAQAREALKALEARRRRRIGA